MKISPTTRLYISVSNRPGTFGASVYNALFARLGIDAVYLPRVAPQAEALCSSIRALQISGCSVSTPLKSAVLPFLDRIEDSARVTGSVNTIVNQAGQPAQHGQSGALVGHNTDVDGIRAALEQNHFESVRIFGSGSVVQSLLHVLKEKKIKLISLIARNVAEKNRITKQHGLNLDDTSPVDLLINATPASLDPSQTALFNQIPLVKTVFDLLVSAETTPLLKTAIAQNRAVIPGLEMAKGQLQKQFELYTGVSVTRAEIDSVVSAAFK